MRSIASRTVCLLLCIVVLFAAVPSGAQKLVGSLSAVGINGSRFVVNPVTNKIYLTTPSTTASLNVVTIIDGATNATHKITLPTKTGEIAVNTVTNKIYVGSTATSAVTIMVIDGATEAVSTINVGAPTGAIAVNEATNRIYVAYASGVKVVDGATNAVTTIAYGASSGATAIAVNPATNKIYALHRYDAYLEVIDGATNTPTKVSIYGELASAAVNATTNKIYVSDFGGQQVFVLDGVSNSVTPIPTSYATDYLAVNSNTNKVYNVAQGSGSAGYLDVIDGATSSRTATLTLGAYAHEIGLNANINRVYTLTTTKFYAVDGATNAITPLTFGAQLQMLAVNPVTNKVYVFDQYDGSVNIVDDAPTAKVATTTAVTSSPNPATDADNITFTATVSGGSAPTGAVTFRDSWGNVLGTANLNTSGVATITTRLAVGPYNVTALYAGDSANYGSQSAMINETVNAAKSQVTIGIVAQPNPALVAQNVLLTVAVTTQGTHGPTGTVVLQDGTTTLATLTLTPNGTLQGIASYNTSFSTAGVHNITATYSGDAYNNGYGPGYPLQLQVNRVVGTTTTMLTSSWNPATAGTAVTLTATVSTTGPVTPTGTVTFTAGPTTLGTATLNASRVATFTTSSLTAGTYSITATYAGDLDNNGSVSAALSQVINPNGSIAPVTISAAAATGIAVNPQTNKIYLATKADYGMVIDGTTNTTKFLNLENPSSSHATLSVAVDPASNHAYISGYNTGLTQNVTYDIDGSTDTVAGYSAGTAALQLAVDTKMGLVYGVSDHLSRIWMASAGTIRNWSPITVGNSPFGIATNSTTTKVYVANRQDGTVTVISGNIVLATVTVGTDPRLIAINETTNKIYVTNYGSNNVTVIDGATNAATTIPAGTNPYALAVNSKTNRIYVANSGSGTVTVIDGATNNTSTLTVGTTPWAVAVNSTTNKIYVANQYSDTVSVIDGATNTVLGAIGVGLNPNCLAVNETTNKVYVGHGGENTVMVIDSSTVPLPPTTLALTSDASNARLGETVNLVATVTTTGSSAPTGTVTFKTLYTGGANTLGTATVDASGVAILSTNTLGGGTYNVVAYYSGDNGNAPSVSPSLTQTITPPPTTTTIASSANPAMGATSTVTFTAAVRGANGQIPTGTVTFKSSGSPLATVFLDSSFGMATYDMTVAAGYTYSITATYNGDPDNASSTSETLTQTAVASSNTATTIDPSATTVTSGTAVTFTATVTATGSPAPTGTVTFYDGPKVIGTATLNGSGVATVSATMSGVGYHLTSATYGGDANNGPSGSYTRTVTVTANPTSTSTTLVSSANPANPGTPVTFTATVVATGTSTPTGLVTFTDGSTILGARSLNSAGVAALTVYGLTVGSHSITASYPGDANNNPSTSVVLTQNLVAASATTTVLTASSSAVPLGTSAVFTATVTGGTHTPTGMVTFKEGGATLGAATLNGAGVATFATSSLAVGSHSIVAVYGGDNYNTGSTSAAFTETVTAPSPTTTQFGVSPALTVVYGTNLTFNVSVTSSGSNAPTGTVVFKEGGNSVGQAALTTPTGSVSFATFSIATLAVGSHSITAEYSGDLYSAPSSSTANYVVVQKGASTATVTASPNPATVGAAVTFTVSVTSTSTQVPSGTVNVIDGKATLYSGQLDAAGTATFTTSTLTSGTHSVYAYYAGDSYTTSTNSANVSVVINPATNPVPTLASLSPVSVAAGTQGTTLTVNGTNFVNNSVVQWNGAARVTNYVSATQLQGTLTPADLAAVGTASVTVFNPTPGGGTSSAQTFTITTPPSATSTTLTSSANPALAGASVTFTATVTTAVGRIPTGTVTFKDGATTLGTATLNGAGIATFSTSTLTVGAHSITADYAGDGNDLASTSAALTQTINAATTTTTLTSTPNPVLEGHAVTFSATVTTTGPIPPSGTVTFKDGTTTLGTGTISAAGVATFSTSTLTVGSHSITAVYGGDTSNAGSTSAVLTQTVDPLPATTTTLTSSANPVVSGTSVTFTATVTTIGQNPPTGTVSFKDGTTTLGTASLNGSGVATFSTSTLSVGSHSITAIYGGDAANASSTSAALTQTINAPPSDTTTTLTASAGTIMYSGSLTFTATVTTTGSHTPAGTVTFKDGALTLGTANVNGSGVATLTTTTLAVGTHSVTADYAGDSNNLASSSAAISVTVTPFLDTTAASLTSSANPAIAGTTVTFTVTVTTQGTHTPTGTVTFTDGTTALGSAALNGAGVSTFATSGLAVGSHAITAAYGGDTYNRGATSNVVAQVIDPVPNPVPVLTAISPTSTNQGTGAVTLTVTGSNFINGSVVQWNGSNRVTTFVSSTQLLAAIPAADVVNAGTAAITVFNPAPGGGTSAPQTFTIAAFVAPVPVITTMTPGMIKAGSPAFSLTVNGNGFAAGAVVMWNGTARTTTAGSDGGLQAAITAADVASSGTADITVVNPTSMGGKISAPVKFVIDTAASAPGSFTATSTSSAVNIQPGQTAQVPVTLSGTSAGATVTISCLNLPANASCTYSNNVVTVTTSASTPVGTYPVIVVFTVTQQIAGLVSPKGLFTTLGPCLPFGFVGMANAGRRKRIRLTMLAVIALALLAMSACGGKPNTSNQHPATATAQSSIAFTLTVH